MTDQYRDAVDKMLIEQATQSHAATWSSRALGVIAATGLAGLVAWVSLSVIDSIPLPPEPASSTSEAWPPSITELPTPKLIDQYPILQPCVTAGEDNCWQPDTGAGVVRLDGMSYNLDDGTPALKPCVTEDQRTDCYWDAGVRGTDGRSFQVRGGFVYYTDGESFAVVNGE